MTRKSVLLILRSSPYQGSRFCEALDALMVAAAFDQRCTLLLLDDAVFALLPGQNGTLLGSRTPGRMLTALPDYEVDRICVCADSIRERHLQAIIPVVPVTLVPRPEQAALLASHDVVWSD